MDFIRPTTWADALAAKAEHPDAVPIAGGTDLMVGLNSMTLASRASAPAGSRAGCLLDLTGIVELTEWAREDGQVRIGANVHVQPDHRRTGRASCPGLAVASRTVGSPQIRNRATVAGNLGTASPAGDAHPPLLAGRRRRSRPSRSAAAGDIADRRLLPRREAQRARAATN